MPLSEEEVKELNRLRMLAHRPGGLIEEQIERLDYLLQQSGERNEIDLADEEDADEP